MIPVTRSWIFSFDLRSSNFHHHPSSLITLHNNGDEFLVVARTAGGGPACDSCYSSMSIPSSPSWRPRPSSRDRPDVVRLQQVLGPFCQRLASPTWENARQACQLVGDQEDSLLLLVAAEVLYHERQQQEQGLLAPLYQTIAQRLTELRHDLRSSATATIDAVLQDWIAHCLVRSLGVGVVGYTSLEMSPVQVQLQLEAKAWECCWEAAAALEQCR